jgi:uncharacterized Tic20 family protein
MSSLFDRTLDRWATDNIAGRGKNALRFVWFMCAAGLCVWLGTLATQNAAIKSALGDRLTAVVALLIILPAIALLGLGLVCLIMSLMNAVRSGKLG